MISDSIATGGHTLAFLRQGSGPAVLIVHGIGGHKEDWKDVMATLADRHTVFAVDMIGFGGSIAASEDITVRTQVEALRNLIDAQGLDRASLIGNSVGGWVTATFASIYPSRVNRLVLVDVAGFKAMFEGPPPVNFYPETVEEMRNLLTHVSANPAAHTLESAKQALGRLNDSGDRKAASAVFKGLFASPRLEDVMPAIESPTLVLWGEQDNLFPHQIADMVCGHIRGAHKQLIGDAGHFPQLDNPVAFIKAVAEFLD